MIAYCPFSNTELYTDRPVVQALCDELQNFALPRSEVAKCGLGWRRRWQEIVKRFHKRLPRWLTFQQYVIVTFERNELRAAYQTGNRPALFEPDY